MKSLININEIARAESSFMQEKLSLSSAIIGVLPYKAGFIIITRDSPFYPKNYRWPDQLSDSGYMQLANNLIPIQEVFTGALINNTLYFDEEINACMLSPETLFPAHYAPHLANLSQESIFSKTVMLCVDTQQRFKISAAHTLSHLMSLAFNKATHSIWTKDFDADDLGNKNIDKAAIYQSKITPLAAVDYYRFGKSIRKKGFDVNVFLKNLNQIASNVNETVSEWLKNDIDIVVESTSKKIAGRRYWKAMIDSTWVTIPCGGTHINNTKKIKEFCIEMKQTETQELIQVTTTCMI